MPNKVARVGTSTVDGRWWVQLTGSTKFVSYDAFDDLPSNLKAKLSVLKIADVGFRDEDVGRKISEDAFWVFL